MLGGKEKGLGDLDGKQGKGVVGGRERRWLVSEWSGKDRGMGNLIDAVIKIYIFNFFNSF